MIMAPELLTSPFLMSLGVGDGNKGLHDDTGAVPPTKSTTSRRGDGDHSASEVAILPFAHLATLDVVQELNDFETDATRSYQAVLGTQQLQEPMSSLRRFSWSDISIQSVLGEGAFSFVFQVQVPATNTNIDINRDIPTTTTTIGATSSVSSASAALKCLKAKTITEPDDLVFNAMDLQVEAQILSRVRHPHIIALQGLSRYRLGDSYAMADGCFLLLEIMETTLLYKLSEWRRQKSEFPKLKRRQRRGVRGLVRSASASSSVSASTMIQQRQKQEQVSSLSSVDSKEAVLQRLLTIAMPVLNAMDYLHSHNIVLRDLKPENVGFDSAGQVKLFDFGLARTIDSVKADDIAGSVCYMAPEVLLGQGTDFKSDVYSMTMVVWELCTLELPMARFHTMEQVKTRVAKGQWRPSTSGIPSKRLRRNIIPKGWAHKVADRPTSKEMERSLEQACGILPNNDDQHDEGVDWEGSTTSSGMGRSFHSAPGGSSSAIFGNTTTSSTAATTTTIENSVSGIIDKRREGSSVCGGNPSRATNRAQAFGFFQKKK